jgi:cytochrome bd-type quinol oxidase subunit 2
MHIPLGLLMGVMFALGLILTMFAFKISDAVDKCSKDNVRHSARGLLVMGVVVMAVSGTMLFTGMENMKTTANVGMTVMALMFMAGIAVLTMASIIHSGCPKARSDTPVLISLASIVSAVSLAYILFEVYQRYGKGKGQDREPMMSSFHF